MQKYFLPSLVFASGLALSCTAAYYSVYGLATLFAGAFWHVVVMGVVLEIAKLVVVSWLYHHWSTSPIHVKSYLTFAVVLLMMITSMGIFGFLSKAHIDQQVKIDTGSASELPILNLTILHKKEEIQDTTKQLELIDSSITKMVEKGRANGALNAQDDQKKNRTKLLGLRDIQNKQLLELEKQKVILAGTIAKQSAEIGPLKYVAEAIYGEGNNIALDKSDRFVIILLIFVFDPLAIFMLIAFNSTFSSTITFHEFDPKKHKPVASKEVAKTKFTNVEYPLNGGKL